MRFGHDPRIRQIAMLDDDRFEILDLTVRAESELADIRFDELPKTGSVIGAIIRDGSPIFPHGSDVLRAGDRVIVFVESRRASLGRTHSVRFRTGIDIGAALRPRRRRAEVAGAGVPAAGRGRDRLRRAVLGVPRRGRDHGHGRARAGPDHGREAGRRGHAARELPGRRADLAAGADLRRAAVHPRRRPAALAAGRRVLRDRLGLHRDRRDARGPRSRSSRARCSSGASSATGSAAWASSCSRSRSCRGCGSAAASCCSPSSRGRPRSSSSATRSARPRAGCGGSTSS